MEPHHIPAGPFIALVGCILFGCGATNSEQQADTLATTKDTVDAPITQAVVETVAPALPRRYEDLDLDFKLEQWSDSLNANLQSESITRLSKTIEQFQSVKSAADLAYFYENIMCDSIQPMMEEIFSPNCQGETVTHNWEWLTEAYPLLAPDVMCDDYEGEGTVCACRISINLVAFRTKAAETPELEDDYLFDALLYINSGVEPGNVPDSPALERFEFESRMWEGCHECAVTLLGNGQWLEVIKKLEQAAPARTIFNKTISGYLNQVLSFDVWPHHHSKADAVAELDGIIASTRKSKLLNEGELALVKEHRELLQHMDNDSFDCANHDCFSSGN